MTVKSLSAATATMASQASTAENEAVISRILDAPRALVFRMWTEPKHVVHWWHPEGFEQVVSEQIDVRPGGMFRIRMHHGSGITCTSRNVYREVKAPERLVYDETCDEAGKPFHQAHMTVSFEELDGKTRITIHARFEWIADRDRRWTPELMRQGWTQGWKDNLALLASYLSSVNRANTVGV